MTNSFMRVIDHCVGMPLCLLLSLVACVHRILFCWRKKTETPPKHIVIIKLFGLGSIILATPLFQAIKRHFPEATITLITFKENEGFANYLEDLDVIHSIRSKSIIFFCLDTLRVMFSVRRERPDVTIDLEFFTRFTAMLTFLIGSRRKVGFFFRMLDRGKLFTDTISFNTQKHITQNFLAMLLPFGITDCERDADTIKLSRPSYDDPIDENDCLLRLSVKEPYVVINPNASGLSYERRWPSDSFVKIIEKITKNYPELEIILIGSRSESSYVNGIIRKCRSLPTRIKSVAGKTNLEELAIVLRHARLFISNDSGPLHLAALYHVPTIALFGPETPILYHPINTENYCFYSNTLHCSPCMSVYNAKVAQCKGKNICMQRIEPQQVYNKIVEYLDRNGRKRDA